MSLIENISELSLLCYGNRAPGLLSCLNIWQHINKYVTAFLSGRKKRCLDQPPSGCQVSSTQERPSIRLVLSVQDSCPLSAKALGPGKCPSCVAGPQGCPPGCLKATCLLASVPGGSAPPSPCPCSRGLWDSPWTPSSPPFWNHAAFPSAAKMAISPDPQVLLWLLSFLLPPQPRRWWQGREHLSGTRGHLLCVLTPAT